MADLLKSKVPGTCYTAEQLCRVVRMYTPEPQPGMIMALNGAWDNKYVVLAAERGSPGVVNLHYNMQLHTVPGRHWTLTIQNLGHYYADNRVRPAKRLKARQVRLLVADDNGEYCATARYHLVKPVGDVVPPSIPSRYNDVRTMRPEDVVKLKQQQAQTAAWVAQNAAIKAAEKAADKAAFADFGIPVKAPPPPPEAILAQFLIQ